MDDKIEKNSNLLICRNNKLIDEIKNKLSGYNLKEIKNYNEILAIEEDSPFDILLVHFNTLLECHQSNELKNKSFSLISHNLRSSLGVVKMLMELIEQKEIEPNTTDFDHTITELVFTIDDAFFLLENFLYWYRIQFGTIPYTPSHLNLKTLINKMISQQKKIVEKKKITVSIQIDSEQTIWGDEFLLLSIFQNLLSNACKFSEENTNIRLYQKIKKNELFLYFVDEGIGISEENMEKIKSSDSFFHSYGTNRESGNGLGLKVCSALAEINHGKLNIKSEKQKGTTVILTLPISETSFNN